MTMVGNFLPGFSEVRKIPPQPIPNTVSQRRRRRSALCVAAGPGWSLWWPVEDWQRLTADEQTAVIAGQTAVFSGELASGRVA